MARFAVFNLQGALLLCCVSAFAQSATPSDRGQTGASPQTPTSPLAASPSGTPVAVPLTIDQIRSNLPSTSGADKFEFLRNQRKTTLDAISSVSAQLTTIEARLKALQTTRTELDPTRYAVAQSASGPISKDRLQARLKDVAADLAAATKKLDDARARSAPKTEQDAAREMVSRIQSFQSDLQDTLARIEQGEKREQERSARLKAADDEIAKLSEQREQSATQLLTYQRLLGAIDDLVNQLFIASDASNSFKLRMSIAFSILVGVVIVGFFVIAWSNDEIKKTIFGNEAGIQFITIFSIVIAVILFGIIGVLESKELSALLGGLSGYILGKGRAPTAT